MIKELAEVLGVTPSGLSSRIKSVGWDDPKVLNFDRHYKSEEWAQTSPYKTVVAGDLAHLSDKYNRYGERV